MRSRVSTAMANYLFDPHSAQYGQLRKGEGGAICGKVNGKNRYGAYVGFKDFVLGRDGETLYVSGHNDGVRSEVYGSFAEAYLNACATKEEKQQHSRATTPAGFDDMSVENLVVENLMVNDTEAEANDDPFAE